jgi:transposase
MIPVPSGVRVWLAVGRSDMRRGMNGLALQVQEALRRDPHAGDLYVFRGTRGNLIKIRIQLNVQNSANSGGGKQG